MVVPASFYFRAVSQAGREMADKQEFVNIDVLKTFEASSGNTVVLQPVSMMLVAKIRQDLTEEFQRDGKQVTIPTAMSKTAYGEEEYELTKDNVDVPGDDKRTKENHRLWDAYLSDSQELANEIRSRVADYMLYAGVVIEEDKGPGEEWLGLLEWMGVEVPDNPRDLRSLYIKTEILKTASDIQEAIYRIQAISLGRNLTADQLRATESLFRSPLPLSGDALSNPLVGSSDREG